MEWTFPEGVDPPEGGDRKFSTGVLKGKTFLDVTLETPENFFAARQGKGVPKSLEDYLVWVKKHLDVDVKYKKLKQCIAGRRQSTSSTCEHSNVHHKGSSARFIRTTCSNCNELLSNVERNPPTTDPDLRRHRRTDHRGSNKHVRKTFCLDCGTHIESIPQSLVGEEVSGLSAEEQALVDCVNEHDTISREQIVCAAELMLAESRRLLPGEYSLLSIGKMFIDCADRAITSPSPIMPVPERRRPRETSPAPSPTAMVMTLEKEALVATLHKDNCPTNLRVVDPFTDAGVWALVDDGCNSCTHSDAWRLNAEEKWNKLGFSSYLKDSKITKFTGVGSAPSTGKWKLPVALQLKESKLVLPGAIDSHEIANSRHPLLISQGCQAKLGFTKSSRKGTITLDPESRTRSSASSKDWVIPDSHRSLAHRAVPGTPVSYSQLACRSSKYG